MFSVSVSSLLGVIVLGLIGALDPAVAAPRVYVDPKQPVEARIDDLLHRMTLEEKLSLMDGNDMESRENKRLGIPSIKMANGPVGVQWGKATAFPSGISMGAAFDPDLIGRLADAMALETLARGRDMLLAPCVNISRAPQGGRNFESYGEDPLLASELAFSFVSRLQSHGVMASTKHFAGNEQEFERTTIDVRIDERTMREIHLPAFQAAVRAGSWSVMSSYNRLNGTYASENRDLLTTLLKEEWGYTGFVISDWFATHSTVESALAGLDLEMPFGDYYAKAKLLAAVQSGQVPMNVIDDKVRRILRVMFQSRLFERTTASRPDPSVVNSADHQRLALEAARDSIVLLKNERDTLPLRKQGSRTYKIAAIGPNAARARNRGGGSSWVTSYYDVSPLEGLRNRAKAGIVIQHAVGTKSSTEIDPIPTDLLVPSKGEGHGLYAEYFANETFSGEPVLTRVDPTVAFDWRVEQPHAKIPNDHFSVRWTGKVRPKKSGLYELAVLSDDGVRLYFDGKLVVNDWAGRPARTHRVRVDIQEGKDYDIRLEYFENVGSAEVRLGLSEVGASEKALREEAVELARKSDVAVLFVGFNEELEGEGHDRSSLSLPAGQDELVEAVARANPRTVVILTSGGSVLMPWVRQVAGIVQAWYPGQEGGNALADLLYGHANFSAKLPVSFYQRPEDASSFGNYPGSNGQVRYDEGIFVGYRHLDRAGIVPLFPFGHGLSYSTFEVDRLKVVAKDHSVGSPNVEVSLRVTNTSRRAGAEVVQLYVHEASPVVERPDQELKTFLKVKLGPGASKRVKLILDSKAFSYWDVAAGKWSIAPGRFEIRVGTSSRSLPLREQIELH